MRQYFFFRRLLVIPTISNLRRTILFAILLLLVGYLVVFKSPGTFPLTSFLHLSSMQNQAIDRIEQKNHQNPTVFSQMPLDSSSFLAPGEFVGNRVVNGSVPSALQSMACQDGESSPEQFPAAESLPPVQADLPVEEVIAEIRNIREAFGGGVGKILSGSPLAQQEHENLFNQNLKAHLIQNQPDSLQSISQSKESVLATHSFSGNNSSVVAGSLSPREVDVRRKTAKLLENAAAKLEEIELYDDADLVREKANQLWQSARNKLESK